MNDDEYRELIERVHEIKEMTMTLGWQHLTTFVNKRIDANRQFLISGSAKTLEEYQARAGLIRGMTYVRDAPSIVTEILDRERDAREEVTVEVG